MAGKKGLTIFYSDVVFEGIRVVTASTEAGLAATSITFADMKEHLAPLKELFPASSLVRDSIRNREADDAVKALLMGKTPRVMPRLDIQLTDFQWKVLEALSRIPFGQTRTYGQLAIKIGMPMAARAVGGALARNPLPIIFPCHRVVASNGLGGFGAGLTMKAYLLDLESRSDSSGENL